MKTKIALVVTVLVLIFGCGTPTVPCGRFTFTGATHSFRGVDVALGFDLNPANCNRACTCDTICYIQITRVIDINTGNFIAAESDQADRIVRGRTERTLNGWAVDRISGRVWGYYARDDDGNFNSNLTLGSSTSTATLRDTPLGWGDDTWFEAVSVPVCIQNNGACENKLLGYYHWQFFVGRRGRTDSPFHQIAVEWHRDAFDEAVVEWNTDASGLGKNPFPAMSRL